MPAADDELRRRGPLSPVETATAAVMAALATALSVVGWLLPHASAVQSLAAVPLGVVAHRHRPRALLAATVAAMTVSFLAAGTGPAFSIVTAAVVGGLVGDVKRRRRGVGTLLAGAVVAGPALAAATDGLLLAFSASRKLVLKQVRSLFHGATGLVATVPGLGDAAHTADRWVATALAWWWLTIGALVMLSFAVGVGSAWVLLGGVLDRMGWMTGEDRLSGRPPAWPDGVAPAVGPLPVHLRDVHVRYRRAGRDALDGIDFDLLGPSLLALVGANGSGKSTLARVLAGAPPTSGQVERPGDPGLGLQGGTAIVAQRPETQVLGIRAADDVVWGLPPGATVDVDSLLAQVGLAGMGERETATLSGGELQRLALAAALARQPALLLSDESTAMVDPEGREQLLGLLRRLPADQGIAVVHVTHRAEEAAAADRVVQLAEGRIVEGALESLLGASSPSGNRPVAAGVGGGRPLLVVRGVEVTYAAGTPWAQPALRGVDLTVAEGEGLLVVGGNGSGKSTLAWVMAGLLRPHTGACEIEGVPVADRVGDVALAFQHARLQVQRPTAGEEVRAASRYADAVPDTDEGWFTDPSSSAGWQRRWDGRRWTADTRPTPGGDPVAAALRTVGLDPAMASQRLDHLSGGQLRRVALAGLVARAPKVLVLDEPLAGLDPPSRRSLLEVLGRLRADGTTLVVISHDLEGMDAVCDRTVTLEQGRIAAPAGDADGAPLVVAAAGVTG